MDHLRRHTLKPQTVDIVVLDEADEMLNMGFREDIETILGQLPEERQTMLFSATMPKPILEIAKRYLHEPEIVKVIQKELTVPKIEQYYYEVNPRKKNEVLSRLLDMYDPSLSLVFCNTKRKVDELVADLKGRGYFAEGLHGDMKQSQRDRVMNGFRNGRTDILVATDVAARGLDISGVTHVYNYDIPQDPESYVHRIGRTGRAGQSGQSITFVAPNEMGYLGIIENLTKKRMKGLKPPTAQEAFQAKKKVALKKIERDFADEAIRSNFDKFKGDAVKLAQEFTPEELALYILSLTVQDPETMPEVEIAREKPLPFKPSGGGFGGKGGKGGRGNRGRDNNRRGGYRGDRNRDDRDGGRRDFKRKSKKNSRDFENRGNKRPHRTSSEKKNGFVIRNKGDK